MKYCMNYHTQLKNINVIDEINIKYNKNNTHLKDFFKQHPNQIINICLDNEQDTRLFYVNNEINVLEELSNFRIRFGTFDNSDKIYGILKEKKIPFFFNKYIADWESLNVLANLGVAAVYITEALAFELDKVSSFCHKRKIQVRVFPNVSQTLFIETTPSLKSFFIRPEDITIYEEYIDIIEFWGRLDQQDIYYDIYHNNQKWYGQLKELIIDFTDDIDSRFILPRFAEIRTHCGRNCLKDGKCSLCDTVAELASTLKERNIIINKERKEDNERSDF